MKNVIAFIASMVLCSGCPPTPPISPDPSPASATCAEACSTLHDLGCPEGLSPDCQATCEITSSKINYRLDCLVAAKTAADARSCGSVTCTP